MAQMSQEELYEQHRLRMNHIECAYRRLFFIYLAFAGVLFFLTIYASVVVANDRSIVGTDKFYVSFGTGVIQILLAVGVLVTGFFISMKSATALVIQISGLVALMVISLMGIGALAKVNVFLALVGLGLAWYALRLYREYAYLKQQPGFPLFSLRAETPAEYVPPLNVRESKPSGEMEDIALSSPCAQQPAEHTMSEERGILSENTENILLAEMEHGGMGLRGQQPHPMCSNTASEIAHTLSQFEESSQKPQAQTEHILPQISPEAMLSDMDSGVRHETVHGALPDPEEVKLRLRRMKDEKEAAEGFVSRGL